jgi:hypothetical protein
MNLQVPRRQPVSAANSATAASLTAAADLESEDTFGDDAPAAAGWAISGTPPHVMTAAAAASAMSMPYGPASPAYGEFRPVSELTGGMLSKGRRPPVQLLAAVNACHMHAIGHLHAALGSYSCQSSCACSCHLMSKCLTAGVGI